MRVGGRVVGAVGGSGGMVGMAANKVSWATAVCPACSVPRVSAVWAALVNGIDGSGVTGAGLGAVTQALNKLVKSRDILRYRSMDSHIL